MADTQPDHPLPTSASHPANHLAGSLSPYLLQHAHNPVEWWPWGPEAIAQARRRGVPIFLSIGYSTCYWCHVMERESFEDPAAAAVLNRVCVPVKVDREERPDLDDVMMSACQVFTHLTEGRASGGWPLNVFLDPETLEPFHAGTYYPPEPAFGRPGFTDLLRAVERAWTEDRPGLRAQAAQLARMVRAQVDGQGQEDPETAVQELVSLVPQALEGLMRLHDPREGGFGAGGPKFPTPAYLHFLMRVRGEDAAIERALRHTLDRMAVGGIFDQVGGGFHRYAVDGAWTVPHFEKMLCDNAQLALLYARAAARWQDAFYAQMTQRTLGYVQREMTNAEGGFFSAQDAEVDGREGRNYLWTPEEVRAAAPEEGAFLLQVYGLDSGPNFRDPHHPQEAPSNVLRLAERPDVLAQRLHMTAEEFLARLARGNAALYAVRQHRRQPRIDDKCIAAWNGLMIEAFAEGARLLRKPEFAQTAARAARFVLRRMRDAQGALRRVWREGCALGEGFLEDYACMANGLLALEGLVPPEEGQTGESSWSSLAEELMRIARARFCDPATGAWFDAPAGAGDLFMRPRSLDDGALPSGTSSALRAMVALTRMQGGQVRVAGLASRAQGAPPRTDEPWGLTARRLLASVTEPLRGQPVSATGTLRVALELSAHGAACTAEGCTPPAGG